MTTRAFVDYLSCTFHNLDRSIGVACAQISELIPSLGSKWGYAKPTNSYKFAARTVAGAVVMVGREDMGVHLEMTGQVLSAIAPTDFDLANVLRWLVGQSAQFSRADFAVDATDTGLDICRLRAMFEDGRADTKIRAFNMIESEKEGLTLYLGSPQSWRRVRIYNKAAERHHVGELPDTEDWIRIEAQLRDEPANTAARLLSGADDMAGAIRSIILSVIDFPVSEKWTAIMRGATTGIGVSRKHKGDRRKWLLGACAGCLAQELYLDPTFKADFERAVQSAALLLQSGASNTLDNLAI